jgi:hypothetical protein
VNISPNATVSQVVYVPQTDTNFVTVSQFPKHRSVSLRVRVLQVGDPRRTSSLYNLTQTGWPKVEVEVGALSSGAQLGPGTPLLVERAPPIPAAVAVQVCSAH